MQLTGGTVVSASRIDVEYVRVDGGERVGLLRELAVDQVPPGSVVRSREKP